MAKVACDDVKAKFNAMDLDGSGEIHARELITIIKDLLVGSHGMEGDAAEQEAKACVYDILKKYDKNDDMKLSWEEFESAYKSMS